jgi:dTDP-4-amino-4,6-dideoxygalactose transaminase
MKIGFNDIGIKAKKYQKLIIKKTLEIIKSGVFLNGKENEKLIKNLSKFLKGGYVTLTASGHDSILLALDSLNLKSSNEIIFPVNSYPTAFPIALSKAKLVPVDVDSNGLINPDEIAKKINKNTRAIIVVHLYGLISDIKKIKSLIKKKKIILIEDCAQAFGSYYLNKPVGTYGDISCFSFYPTKNLGALGDGGAIWTKNKKIYKFFKQAVGYGEKEKYNSEFISGHSRLSEIQAGIINVYFKDLKKTINLRKKALETYQKLINKFKLQNKIRILFESKNSSPLLHLLVIECKNRDKLKNYLIKNKIPIYIHYPIPTHLVPAFSYLNYKKGGFPIAEKLSKNILSLPFHSEISKKEIFFIIKSVADFYIKNEN